MFPYLNFIWRLLVRGNDAQERPSFARLVVLLRP